MRVDLVSMTGLGFIAQEVAVGLAIGFAARLMFAAFDLAGEVIGLVWGTYTGATSVLKGLVFGRAAGQDIASRRNA